MRDKGAAVFLDHDAVAAAQRDVQPGIFIKVLEPDLARGLARA
jgi:hypothetical protein